MTKIIEEFEYGIRVLHEQLKFMQLRTKARSIERQLRSAGARCVDAEQVWFRPNSAQTECHVIGSGWSLNASRDLAARPEAFVVGFNQAALCELEYDAYFLEFAGPGLEALMDQQRRLAERRVLPHTKAIYFKGLWLERTDPRYALKVFGDIAYFVKDIEAVYINVRRLPAIARFLLTPDREFVRQYLTTVLTIVSLAAVSGFKEIVLHGVDFTGPYFYESLSIPADLQPPELANYYKRNRQLTASHPTGAKQLGLPDFLPIMKGRLGQHGINLRAATPKSPSAVIIGY